MDRGEVNQENPSLLSANNSNTKDVDYSPRKPQQMQTAGGGGGGGSGSGAAAVGGGNDRLKRDEWSEGAVSSLLEAYEAKWILRNRAKLKGQDWEDVAKHVSARANSTKSPKTQTQCKNKIESMKKRYRSESATADASSWPLYPRLDLLLRGNAPPPPPPPPQIPPPPQPSAAAAAANNQPILSVEISQQLPSPAAPQPSVPPVPVPRASVKQNSHGSNGLDHRGVDKEDGTSAKPSDDELSDKNRIETDSSTPVMYPDKEHLKSKNIKIKTDNNKKSKKRRRGEEGEIAESIRCLAEVVMRSEQARMETMRELERMRAEAEAKKGEMDLRRTEIIANTQLEIAKLLAGAGKGVNVDSSLRIGRS